MLIPNASLTFMLEHICTCEFLGGGLTLDFAKMEVNSVNYWEGLAFLVFDMIYLGLLGYYLDQTLPK